MAREEKDKPIRRSSERARGDYSDVSRAPRPVPPWARAERYLHENVLDETQSDGLTRCKRETHQGSKSIKGGKVVCKAASEAETGSQEGRPEQHRSPAPEVDERNPTEASNTKHHHIEVSSRVDVIRASSGNQSMLPGLSLASSFGCRAYSCAILPLGERS